MGHAATTVHHDEPGVRLKAVYAHLDCLLAGIARMKADHTEGWTVQSPLPRHEILEAVYEGRPSPVRWWTLTGAIAGLHIGFLLPALTAAQWPMINPGGKPVVSLVPYAVIMFECTILFGSIATLLGLMFHSGVPAMLDRSLKDPRVTDASFTIVFPSAPRSQVEKLKAALVATGAIEVTTGDDAVYEVPNV